jgi:outer membrane immunogenic protein
VKKLITVAAAIAAFGFVNSASAADMPPKAVYKAPIMAPAWSWAGFYIGGDVGARWSRARWTTLDFDPTAPSTIDNPANLKKTSFRFGGYAGYNWMFAPAWLVGLEADIGWAGGTATHSPFPGSSIFSVTAGDDFVNAKLTWDASVRGRLGYLVAPNWLVYGTGGVAWANINTSASCTGTGNSFCGSIKTDSFTLTKTGWTAGLGVETMLWGNWIGRAEYRYANFGHVSNTLPPPSNGFHADVGITTNIALLGLAYKFGN